MNYSYIRKAVASVSAIAVLATSVASFGLSTATAATSFTDASGIATWASDSVQSLVDAGVLAGRDNGSFDPQGQLNRAELSKIATLAANLNIDTTGAPHFNDVAPSDWYYSFVETLYNNGVVGGINGGALDANGLATYNSGGVVNRAEGAKILVDAFALETSYAGSVPNFADVASSAWYFDSVETAYAHGLMNGYDDGRFGPGDAITREQVAVVAQSSVTEAADGSKRRATYTAGAASTAVASGNEETPPPAPVASDGTLSVAVAASSPASATLPGLVSGVTVASFDFTASSDDVVVTSVEIHRGGLGIDAAVTNIALFDNTGRVSKAKSFNSSTDVATVNFLGGGLTVAAGTTNTIRVVATLATTATANVTGSQFNMEILSVDAIAANAQSVTGSFPAAAATMEIGSSNGQAITIATNGSVSNPKLGEKGVEVAKFKLTNADADNEVLVHAITLKETGTVDEETEVVNYNLYIEGQLVATAATATNKYVTFNLDTTYAIKTSKTAKAVVTADIVGGAAKTIILGMDNVLDIEAEGTKYGYGASISGTYTQPTATIQAGQLTIISNDAPVTDVLKNKDNLVIGSFSMVPGTDSPLEFQEFRMTLTNSDASSPANLDAVIENVELYDVTTGSVYDLTATAAATASTTYTDSSLTIAIAGTHEFQIRVDTLNVSVAGVILDASIANIGTATTGGIVVQETQDDTNVSDITPSSVTYKSVNGVSASATVAVLTQSATNAVIGSSAVDALEFEIEAGTASDLYLSEVKVKGVIVDNSSTATTTATTTLTVAAVPAAAETIVIGGCTVTFSTAVDELNCTDSAANVKQNDVGESTTTIATSLDSLTNITDATQGVLVVTAGAATTTVFTAPAALTGSLTFTDGTTGDVTAAATAGITAANDGTDVLADNTRVNQVALYNGTTLLDTVSGSQLASGVATFDGFREMIAANGILRLRVEADIIDDTNQGNDTLNVNLTSLVMEDYDADDLTTVTIGGVSTAIGTLATASNRTVTIKGAGSLTLAVDNTDTATSSAKNVLGGATSDFVASFEATATNEGVQINDLTITETSGGALKSAVSEVVLYANDKTTEIGRKSVTSDTVTFTNINHKIAEGSENIYVKVVALAMGKDRAGTALASLTLAANATDNTGSSSNKTIAATGASSNSNAFSTVPVRISNIAFVSTATVNGQTVTVDSTLTNGTNTVAIIAITTDASTTTNATTGAAIKTELTGLTFSTDTDMTNASGTQVFTANSVTVERVGGTGDKTFATIHGAPAGAAVSTAVTLSTVDAINRQIENSTTAYFAVKAAPSGITTATGNKNIQIKFTALDGSDIDYDTDELTVYTDVAALNLGSTTLDAPKVASNY